MAYSQTQKTPHYWSGEDCRTWAVNICEKHRFSQFNLNLHAFEKLSGQQLLGYSKQDIGQLVGLNYEELFYKELHNLKNNFAAYKSGTFSTGSASCFSNNIIASTCISGDTIQDQYVFNNSNGSSSNQSDLTSNFQPHLPFSQSTKTVNYNTSGLKSTAQLQPTYTSQDNSIGQDSSVSMFTQEGLEELQIIDETIVEELSKFLQSSNISEFQSGYSDSKSLFNPSINPSLIGNKYDLGDSCVPDMYSNSVFTPSTRNNDQTLYGGSGITYDNCDQIYETGYDGGFIGKESLYISNQYDESFFQDIKPNIAPEESYNVPNMNTPETHAHNCLYDSIQNPNRKSRKRGPKVWEFVLRCLLDSQYNPSLVSWEDPSTGTFRIVQPEHLAKLWGARTGKPDLSYENFSRSLRYHYKQGMLEGLSDRHLVYRFTPRALQAFKRNTNVHS